MRHWWILQFDYWSDSLTEINCLLRDASFKLMNNFLYNFFYQYNPLSWKKKVGKSFFFFSSEIFQEHFFLYFFLECWWVEKKEERRRSKRMRLRWWWEVKERKSREETFVTFLLLRYIQMSGEGMRNEVRRVRENQESERGRRMKKSVSESLVHIQPT